MKKKILLLTIFILLLSTGCSTLLKEIGIIGKDITITYITNSETVISPIETKNNIGYILEKPIAPQKEGYIFDGWYFDSQFTKPFSYSQKITEDTTLYAKWGKIPVATYITNSDIVIKPQTAYYNEIYNQDKWFDFTVRKPGYMKREGYIFDGWYSDSQLTNPFPFSKKITEDTTLYAKWIKIPVVTYITNSDIVIKPQEADYDESYTQDKWFRFYFKEPESIKRDGYIFDGWYSDSQFTKSFSFFERITEDTTLYAKWVKIPIVTFVTKSETIIKPTESKLIYYNNKTFNLQEPITPQKKDYRFEGWFSDPECKILFDFSKTIDQDITIYAKWGKIPVATFITNSDTSIKSQKAIIDKDSNKTYFKKPITPTKNGYLFDGWYTDSNFTNLFIFEDNIDKDTTFYAKWVNPKNSKWIIESGKDKFGDDTGKYFALNKYNISGNFKDTKNNKINMEFKLSYDINTGLKFIFINDNLLTYFIQDFIISNYLPIFVEYKTEKTKGVTFAFLVIDEKNKLSIISNFYSPILNLSSDDLIFLYNHNMNPLEKILYENIELHLFFTFNNIGTIEIPKLKNENFYSVLNKLGIIE